MLLYIIISFQLLYIYSVNLLTWRYFSSYFSRDGNYRYVNSFVYVAVNFFLQLNFILPLFWGMVMYHNEFKTKEK